MSFVAALDCGTNSLRLLITSAKAGEQLRRTEIVRLGQGVDRTGVLSSEALARTRAVLESYAEDIRRYDVSRIKLVATSALRDASNRSDFSELVVEVLGVEPEIVSGREEALLTFRGAARELHGGGWPGPHGDRVSIAGSPGDRGAERSGGGWLVPPVLVVDIGGGSTECVMGTTDADHMHSVDIGCVRLTERHLSAQAERPPTDAEVAALVADVNEALDALEAAVPIGEARSVVCVAGTATTVAAIALGLSSYSRERIHHAHIRTDTVCEIADRLVGSTTAQVAAIPSVHPGRADVLTAGVLVLRTVLERVGAGGHNLSTESWNVNGYTASEHDILDGIAWSVIDEQV